MDFVIVFFRDVLDGPLYIAIVVINSILICSCIGYLAEQSLNRKKAKEKNVLIVVVDTNVYEEDFVDCTITSDNYHAGVIVGKYFLEQCETAKVVIMTHETAKSGQDSCLSDAVRTGKERISYLSGKRRDGDISGNGSGTGKYQKCRKNKQQYNRLFPKCLLHKTPLF